MSSTERVLSALNFLTGEGVNYYHDGCDGSAIEALIADYFNEGPDDDSDDESDHRNEGKNAILLETLPCKHSFRATRFSNTE